MYDTVSVHYRQRHMDDPVKFTLFIHVDREDQIVALYYIDKGNLSVWMTVF